MPGEMTPAQFSSEVLRRLGIKPNTANIAFMVGWIKLEGGHTNGAKYNYLNTTQPMPGAGNTGTQGNIKVYTSWNQGIEATVKTLRYAPYKSLVASLRGSSIGTMATALAASPWCPNCPGYGEKVKGAADEAAKDDGLLDKIGDAALTVLDPLGIGSAVVGGAGDVINTAADAGEAVAHVAGALLNPSTWLRVGKGVLGGVLIIAGAGALIYVVAGKVQSSPTVKAAAAVATKVK